MADVTTAPTSASGAAPVAAKPSTSKKTVKAKKPLVPAEHPKYGEMISSAIGHLKERRGSSRQAILKYILANYKVGTEVGKINARVKMALRAGIKSGSFRQIKGSGASGSFRLGERPKTAKPKTTQKPKASVTKKPAVKKSAKTTTLKKKPAGTAKKADAKKSKTGQKRWKATAKLTGKKTTKAKGAKSPAKKVAKKAMPKKMAKKSPAKKVNKGKVTKAAKK